jgi:hypothetical protein
MMQMKMKTKSIGGYVVVLLLTIVVALPVIISRKKIHRHSGDLVDIHFPGLPLS